LLKAFGRNTKQAAIFISKLIVYFIGHEPAAEDLGLDLQKGILLTGPIGCGKTSLMTLMKFVPPPERNHIIKSCRDISFEFIQEGYEVIGRYSRMSYNGHNPKIYCFDDLGAEQSLKYYGNKCNVLGEILLSRYDLFVSEDDFPHYYQSFRRRIRIKLWQSPSESYAGNV